MGAPLDRWRAAKADSIAAGHNLKTIMANSLMHDMAKGCDDALAIIVRIQANPTATAFSQSIETAARDVIQYAGNIDRLTADDSGFAKAQPHARSRRCPC
jgi:hypothetical protein